MTGNDFAIRLEEVSKSFGSLKVLDHLSFAVPRASTFCILGRSGTGKSVTLKQIVGLMKPDSGKIFVDDEEITNMDSRRLANVRKKIGFLFQSAALFDSVTVGENVAFPLRRHTRYSNDRVLEIAREKLTLVGLEKSFDKMPADLSGGMQKRAGLARALAMNPEILLVDEPSSGLDPITSREIDELLMEMKTSQNVTSVIVTHNIPSARRLADQIIMLHQGRIIAEGTVADLEGNSNEIVQAFIHSKEGG